MAKQRAVVVGAGGISNAWFGPLLQEKVAIEAVVDLSRSAAAAQIDKYELDAEAYDDLDAALKANRPDIVVDLTIPDAHCEVTCKALKAGAHVIGEKPMANSMAEARKMVRAAEGAGKVYMVSQNRRAVSTHERARRTAAKLGDLTTLNCDFYIGAHFGGFRDAMPSPLILDMAIHHFDLARFLTGKDPLAVYAHEFNPAGSWYAGDVAASCIFEMTDGVVFTYRGSWCAEGCHTSWNGDWRVIGTKGTMILAGDQEPYGEVVAGKEGFFRPKKPLKTSTADLKYTGQHAMLREFLSALRTGKRPSTECHDNIKSLAMVFAAIESSSKGKRVEVKV